MAGFAFGTAARVWLDGKQAACAINDINQQSELDEAETTVLCSTIKDYIPGLAEVTVDMEGYYDTNTASPATTLEAWMDARIGTSFPMTFAPEGGADVSDPVYILNGFLQHYEIEATVDEAVGMKNTFRGTSGLSRAKIIQAEGTAKIITANGTGVDNTTSSAFGATAVLQVSAVTGTTPTMVVKIQHSTDNVTYADLITFTSDNAVNGQYGTATGTINRYLRAIWTITGTLPSFTFNVAVARLTS